MTIYTASPIPGIGDPANSAIDSDVAGATPDLDDDDGEAGTAALWHSLLTGTASNDLAPTDADPPTPGDRGGSAPGQGGGPAAGDTAADFISDAGYAAALTGFAGDAGLAGSATDGGPQLIGYEPGTGAATGQAAAGDTGAAGPVTPGVTLTQLLQSIGDTGVAATGAGEKVGVISDSFDSLGGYAANDDDGLLPAGVQIATFNGTPLDEGAGKGTDEGAAMLEIVHAIAPQASLAFASGGTTDAQFVDAVEALQSAGCNVIVDDLSYTDEPFFQTSLGGQAIANAEAAGVTYVTNSGNSWGGSTDNVGYLSSWNEITATTYDGFALTDALNFGNGSPVQTVTITPGSRWLGEDGAFVVQWAQPWGVSAADVSNLQLVVFQNGREIGTFTNQNAGLTPPQGFTSNEFAFIEYNFGSFNTTQTFQVAIENLTPSRNPPEVEDMLELNGFNETNPPTIDTPSSVSPGNTGGVFGHHTSPDAITVGAINAMDTPAFDGGAAITSEAYSASNPAPPLYFNVNGTEVSGAPQSPVNSIDVSGVDDIQTTVTSGPNEPASEWQGANGPFTGTSAAAPTVAAVVALMLQVNPQLTEPEIDQLLEQTAIATSTPGQAGAGLVDAAAAVSEAAPVAAPSGLALSPSSMSGFTASNTTDVNTPTITGAGSAGDTVTLDDGATSVGSATVGADGTWSIATSQLAPGAHTLTATETDNYGVSSAASSPLALTIVKGSDLVGDFTDNGKDDLVWQNPSDPGVTEIMLLNGAANAGGGVISNSPFGAGWNIVGIGDFTGNGKGDLVWQNSSDPGVTEIEELNGAANAGGGTIANSPFGTGWNVVGVGDFTGNGKDDLVWQNPGLPGVTEIEELNGAANAGGGVISNSPFGAGWNVVGVGDFTGNGKDDLVWQNASDPGVTEIELLNGAANAGGGTIANSPFGTGWNIVGVGDFTGNGKDDLVWQNPTSFPGVTEIEELNGAANAGGGTISNSPFGAGWNVVGVGDFTGNGKDDLVWQNASFPGTTEIELLNGAANAGGGVIANNPFGAGWFT